MNIKKYLEFIFRIFNNNKTIIIINIVIIVLVSLVVRIFVILSDLRNKSTFFENKDSLNFYATTLFIKPFSLLANKYAISEKKKIEIIFNYDKREISDSEKRNCYILTAKRPNIFVQNYIADEDYLAINMQIGAISNNNDNNIKLNSIASLIEFIEKNKMTVVLDENNHDIKNIILNWYERYIVADICQSVINKVVPLGKYSINDIFHKQIIATLKTPDTKGKYVISVGNLHLISNERINIDKISDYLHNYIDLIFVNASEGNDIKEYLKDMCVNSYLNNDFANMLNNMKLKNLITTSLSNNEIAIGLVSSIINSGKLIYVSSNKEDLTTWLIASGQDKSQCYNFFNFIKQNENLLKDYGIVISNSY